MLKGTLVSMRNYLSIHKFRPGVYPDKKILISPQKEILGTHLKHLREVFVSSSHLFVDKQKKSSINIFLLKKASHYENTPIQIY